MLNNISLLFEMLITYAQQFLPVVWNASVLSAGHHSENLSLLVACLPFLSTEQKEKWWKLLIWMVYDFVYEGMFLQMTDWPLAKCEEY